MAVDFHPNVSHFWSEPLGLDHGASEFDTICRTFH